MHNRIDAALTPADIQDIQNAFDVIKAKIDFGKALTEKERRKGGWYLSANALLLLEKLLVAAKFKPANFPKLDINGFERDVKLIKQLEFLETQVLQLQYLLKDTRRMLTQDATEQGSYVYATIKIFHELGIEDGEAFKDLQQLMPRTGKTGRPKEENP